MRKRDRRAVEGVSLSFLDCICCGFGAVILMLVLVKTTEQVVLEETTRKLSDRIVELQEENFKVRGEVEQADLSLNAKRDQLSVERTRLARLQGDISRVEGEFAATRQDAQVTNTVESRLASAKQSLTEDMQRLLGPDYSRRRTDNVVGGLPVDSQYIIFVIDTSGSMANYAWDMAIRKLTETLDIYPRVRGIQIMNDMGQYMFRRYAGKWIPDTPARRKAIIARMRNWNAFSNSSPVEGITKAISTFYAPDKQISVYVFGDEFTGGSIQRVVDAVDSINRADASGNRRVRIHAVGFPTMFSQAAALQVTGIRFATLMRILCERNGGTFVGLQSN